MIRFILVYMLLVTSFAFPPLLVVSIPLTYVYTRRILRGRRMILNVVAAIEEEDRRAQIVKAFR